MHSHDSYNYGDHFPGKKVTKPMTSIVVAGVAKVLAHETAVKSEAYQVFS